MSKLFAVPGRCIARRFRYAHASTLKTFMLGKNFLERHNPPGFFFPLTLRTDLDALLAGGVKASSLPCIWWNGTSWKTSGPSASSAR